MIYGIKMNSNRRWNNSIIRWRINKFLPLSILIYHLNKFKEPKNQNQQGIFTALNHKHGTKGKKKSRFWERESAKKMSIWFILSHSEHPESGTPHTLRVTLGAWKAMSTLSAVVVPAKSQHHFLSQDYSYLSPWEIRSILFFGNVQDQKLPFKSCAAKCG